MYRGSIMKNIEKFVAFLFNYIVKKLSFCFMSVFNFLVKLIQSIGMFLKNFINFSDGDKIALFCGITALIVPFIIFIAEIINSKDEERTKTYKRTVLYDSWILPQLFLIMTIFVFMFGASEKTYILNGFIAILIGIEIFIFLWKFTHILSILNSSKFYKKIRNNYIEKMIKKYNKYNKKSEKRLKKNKKYFENLKLNNIVLEKHYFDFEEKYERIIAEHDGVIKGIKNINLREINNTLNDNDIETNDTRKQETQNSKVIISYIDGQYIKKGFAIAYIPKKHRDLIKKFNKVEVKTERNNDEIITDIFRDYLHTFIKYSSNSSNYLSQESYFDFYEFACKILDDDNINLTYLLQDSIGKMRFNIDRSCKTSINNVISICKNLLIYDSKNEENHFDFEINMIDIITHDSFILLDLCKNGDARKYEVKNFVQNVAAIINYEFRYKKRNIKNYFYTSISEYIKLIACSSYDEKVELINIIVNNLSFDRNDYDIWTIIRNRELMKKFKSPKKIELLKQNNAVIRYNVDLINSYVLTTLLGILYGNFNINDEYFEMLKKVADGPGYGYDLEEILLSYLNLNRYSEDIINKWGIIENPYDIVSGLNIKDLKEALILFLNIADIHCFELSDDFIDVKHKNFFEGLIKQLKESKKNDLIIACISINNHLVDTIISELTRIYELILKKEKSNIINAKLKDEVICKFESVVSNPNSKFHLLYNYYNHNNFIINSRNYIKKYSGYNIVIDKEIMLEYNTFTSRMAEDYHYGLIDYNEKRILESLEKCTTKFETNIFEDGIESSIDNLLNNNVDAKDILIVGNYMYSKKIGKKNKYYKYNGIKYKILNGVTTNNKVYVVDKKKLPKLMVCKFNNKDLKNLKVQTKNIKNDGKLLVKISDLAHDTSERKRILKENPEWLNQEKDKEEYIKTKVLLMIFQKIEIEEIETSIGYSFDN